MLLAITYTLKTFWEIALFTIVIILCAWLFSRLVRFMITKIIKRRIQKAGGDYSTTSLKFLMNSIKFFSMIIALVVVVLSVPALRSKATFIFSGAGILAAIIGFAAQAAISNLIAGAFIVIFKPFRVGDFIRLDESRVGIVQDITLRHTVINNFENKRLIIPNSIISTESVLNHTIDDSQVLSFNNFYIGIYADVDIARKIIQEEVSKLDYIIDNPNSKISSDKNDVEVRFISSQNYRIHLRAYIWISEPFEEFRNRALLAERVHKRFITEGIDMPVDIYKIVK
ncbi:mechanosensitive ion channel family protein [Urechidicola vernalis]|uniref:Mechanosensitive ion channel family protein n=1 Tax=Urechidicola vernalis TaxID=3075600 RepID=A0ABU2Y1G0_9FLAO|nr:mechanosensitive ion channel family protein [Urechidicola sp. P050]MDT0552049.1 mechanosensitive ion channel family protein [Urechidicola sp. P050]